ncbi:MAG: hypothetical protein JXQ29_18610 [Planctomycetes bacterium]|nr:hypothetical protein [Planctomycetota bacterium]
MSLSKVTVVSGITGGPRTFSAGRDLEGVMWVAYYDPSDPGGACVKVMKSTDDGASWAAESWSQAVAQTGGDEPVLRVDPGNNVQLVVSRFAGVDSPHWVERNAVGQYWGGPGVYLTGYQRLTTRTAVAALDFCVDPSRVISGRWNIVAAYLDGGKVYVRETAASGSLPDPLEREIGGTNPTDLRLMTNSAGYCAIAYLDSGRLMYSNRGPGDRSGGWKPPVAVEQAGDTVTSVEAVAIDANGLPTVLYRYLGAGWKSYLKLVETRGPGVIAYSRVDYATPLDFHFYRGCSLQYDMRGSVYVIGLMDVGLGRAEPVLWQMQRALGDLTWTYQALETGSSADSQWTQPLGIHNPDAVGFRPGLCYQGAAGWYLKNDTDIIWFRADPYPGTTGYPTILSIPAGEPPYRERVANDIRATVPLAGEGTALTTFPLIPPQTSMTVATEFVTAEHRFEAGYRATIAVYEDGRTWYKVAFDNVADADATEVADFIAARLRDQAPFTWTRPDTQADVTVFIVGGLLVRRKAGPNHWHLGEFLFSERVVT